MWRRRIEKREEINKKLEEGGCVVKETHENTEGKEEYGREAGK